MRAEKQLSGRDRRFRAWSRAAALMEKTGLPFDEVLPMAMAGLKLTSNDIRGVQELQEQHQEIRAIIFMGSTPASTSTPAPLIADEDVAPDSRVELSAPVEDSTEDVSVEDLEPEVRLLAARDRVIEYLHWNRALPCHVLPFPKLGASFFVVGKLTVEGDPREWNHNGKHGKFKALIPLCDTKIINLNGENFPKAFFFEDWTWQVHEKEKKALCSGNLKVFCLKHEVGAEYICWVNPGGKGDPWRYEYKMTATGVTLSRLRLKPGSSKEDYARVDAQPIVINPIDFAKIDFAVPKQG